MAKKKIEYLVNGAIMKCDQGSLSNKLLVPVSHGMYMSGQAAAHNQDCVPFINIQSFGVCSSGSYFASKKAVPGKKKPCVLDLLDQFYFSDQYEKITNSFEILPIANKVVDDIIFNYTTALNLLNGSMRAILLPDDPLTVLEFDNQKLYMPVLKKCLDPLHIKEYAGDLQSAISGLISVSFGTCAALDSKANQVQKKDLAKVKEMLSLLPGLIPQLLALPELKENTLITMDAILICRCGGQIKAIKCGQ